MYTCDATTPLLLEDDSSDDVGDCNELRIHDEDSSSGYESSDFSDTESDNESTSRPRGYSENVTVSPKRQTNMMFKSTHALCEDLKLILDMPEMCDVTFLVGPSQVPVHGVRAILGTRSKVFYQLILKHLQMHNVQQEKSNKKSTKQTTLHRHTDRLTIPVRKYDPEVFRMLIQFIHCGTASFTDDTVSGIFCGADQFELPELEDACWEYIDMSLASGRGERLLFSTRCYIQHRAAQDILNRIYSVLDRRFIADASSPAMDTKRFTADMLLTSKDRRFTADVSSPAKESAV